jgi:hypothetical protein
VFEEGETVQIVDESLLVLIHSNIFDHHHEVILIRGQRKGQSEISNNELFDILVFHSELLNKDLVTHLVIAVFTSINEPFYGNEVMKFDHLNLNIYFLWSIDDFTSFSLSYLGHFFLINLFWV